MDDVFSNRRLLARILESLGFSDIPSLVDGQQAVNMLEVRHFDMIFMDVQMPVMDGRKATQAIRSMYKSHGRTPEPVIIGKLFSIVGVDQLPSNAVLSLCQSALTAYVTASDREECMAAGMDDVLSKPINMALLKEKLLQYAPLQTNGKIN